MCPCRGLVWSVRRLLTLSMQQTLSGNRCLRTESETDDVVKQRRICNILSQNFLCYLKQVHIASHILGEGQGIFTGWQRTNMVTAAFATTMHVIFCYRVLGFGLGAGAKSKFGGGAAAPMASCGYMPGLYCYGGRLKSLL